MVVYAVVSWFPATLHAASIFFSLEVHQSYFLFSLHSFSFTLTILIDKLWSDVGKFDTSELEFNEICQHLSATHVHCFVVICCRHTRLSKFQLIVYSDDAGSLVSKFVETMMLRVYHCQKLSSVKTDNDQQLGRRR